MPNILGALFIRRMPNILLSLVRCVLLYFTHQGKSSAATSTRRIAPVAAPITLLLRHSFYFLLLLLLLSLIFCSVESAACANSMPTAQSSDGSRMHTTMYTYTKCARGFYCFPFFRFISTIARRTQHQKCVAAVILHRHYFHSFELN